MIRLLLRVAGPCLVTFAVLCAPHARAQTLLLREPTISKTSIAFVYGGDIWVVPRVGGEARRLTANPSIKRNPTYSPDGREIAFTGNYDGAIATYVMPSDGGVPVRLTYHPDPSVVVTWTPDSKSVMFISTRASVSRRISRFFTVPASGGAATMLPLPEGELASYSPDGGKLAYTRLSRANATWKRYRGGDQAWISLYDFHTGAYSELPHGDETDFFPMWHGDRIYFASDRTNTVNLFYYDLKTRATKQVTHYDDYDVKRPSLGPDAIVFEQGGAIHTLDLTTNSVRTVPITVRSDMARVRPSLMDVTNEVTEASISPSGIRGLLVARGEVFTVPAKHGEVMNLSPTPGARQIAAEWSPDGKSVAWFSDASGEYELYVRSADGTGTSERVTHDGHVYRTALSWSPDSKKVMYTDAAMRIWYVDVAAHNPVLIDTGTEGEIGLGAWSPDSKWITYTKVGHNHLGRIFLYSLGQGKSFQVTDGSFNDGDPVFDLNGKYLYFTSDRNFVPSISAPEIGFNLTDPTSLYLLVLKSGQPSPLLPENDVEKGAPAASAGAGEAPPPGRGRRFGGGAPGGAPGAGPGGGPAAAKPADVSIDLDGLSERIVPLGVPFGSYGRLTGGTGKVFFVTEGGRGRGRGGGGGGAALEQFDLTSKTASPIMTGIQSYEMNPSATKFIYRAGPVIGIADAAPGQAPGTGKLDFSLKMWNDPPKEWMQIYNEAWRQERDFYYDPNMKGLNWPAIGERYRKLVPYVADRDDLTFLLGELIGELNTSHTYVSGVAGPPQPQVSVGLLGVDFTNGGPYYRFRHIYKGENWSEATRSPLTEPGVDVKEGDYLIAVNGAPVPTSEDPYKAFLDTVGHTISLTVNSRPSAEGAHTVMVRPVASEGGIRNADWVRANMQRVSDATNGEVGYIYVPDTSIPGMTAFARGFYSQLDKKALIVDERYNSGGFIPTFYTEKLGRKLLSMATPRWGNTDVEPVGYYGPECILENSWSGSGGDAFPYYFRKAGIGPIIGTRTWGGLVGISGSPPLVDGGSVTVPTFGIWSPQDGKWIAENHGIDPDIPVDNRPDQVIAGHDPQLERAIAYIQEQLRAHPPVHYTHPPFPVEHLGTGGN